MDETIPESRFADKQKLLCRMRKCRDAGLKTRYLIIVNLFTRTPTQTAAAPHIARSTVYRVAARFRQFGEWGLLDRREDNGQLKLSEYVLAELDRLVRDTPEDYGWPRPTWTRKLLAATLLQRTGLRVHVATLSRALAMIRARRARPRPTVGCPWSKPRKNRLPYNVAVDATCIPIPETTRTASRPDLPQGSGVSSIPLSQNCAWRFRPI